MINVKVDLLDVVICYGVLLFCLAAVICCFVNVCQWENCIVLCDGDLSD